MRVAYPLDLCCLSSCPTAGSEGKDSQTAEPGFAGCLDENGAWIPLTLGQGTSPVNELAEALDGRQQPGGSVISKRARIADSIG